MLRIKLELFVEFSDIYVESNKNISDIANKTNLLSLASSTKELIEANDQQTATTEEIIAQSDMIKLLSDEIQSDVNKM